MFMMAGQVNQQDLKKQIMLNIKTVEFFYKKTMDERKTDESHVCQEAYIDI